MPANVGLFEVALFRQAGEGDAQIAHLLVDSGGLSVERFRAVLRVIFFGFYFPFYGSSRKAQHIDSAAVPCAASRAEENRSKSCQRFSGKNLVLAGCRENVEVARWCASVRVAISTRGKEFQNMPYNCHARASERRPRD